MDLGVEHIAAPVNNFIEQIIKDFGPKKLNIFP